MARGRSSLFAVVLLVDALLLGAWSCSFVSAPRAGAQVAVPVGLAVAAMTQLPAGAEAVEKWEYKEPSGELRVDQILLFLSFFLIHAAGVADFYAKKVGAGPAVPFNPFRQQQFFDDSQKNGLFGYEGSFYAKKDKGYGRKGV